ncbi:MAG: cobyrinate a,c-diamide synthase [Christensenellaceae bacterium]|nr:cobyrinate a,c-diamide synthase [Christensenellaceae bacterium]
MSSGSGKTVFTCALMKALADSGLSVESFKCGPDYIDPMFHREVLGIKSRNLDLFLEGEEGVRRTLSRQMADIAVIEGVMGYYDGVSGTVSCSTYETARAAGSPAVLVVRPKGTAVTLAAQIKGMIGFREDSMIAGVALTDIKSGMYKSYADIIKSETGLPVIGFIPHMEEAEIESRHLGLVTAGELPDIKKRIDACAKALSESLDFDTLLETAGEAEECEAPAETASERAVIAVAKDEAFSFYYDENIELMKEAGADIVYFSPLDDERVPDADGLYIGGGYPELMAEKLEANVPMRESVKACIEKGMPTVAECGGFMYLMKSIENEKGNTKDMAGYLDASAFKTDRLKRFGYVFLESKKDSLLFNAGDRIPAHEFHYWDATDCGSDLKAVKPDGRSWECAFTSDTLYAGFPHMHFGGKYDLAERFVSAAERYAEKWR